jgi:hypothetical protein
MLCFSVWKVGEGSAAGASAQAAEADRHPAEAVGKRTARTLAKESTKEVEANAWRPESSSDPGPSPKKVKLK